MIVLHKIKANKWVHRWTDNRWTDMPASIDVNIKSKSQNRGWSIPRDKKYFEGM